MIRKLIKFIWRVITKPFRYIFGKIGIRLKRLYNKLYIIYENLMEKINKNIRFQLIVTFGVCLFLSFILFTMLSSYFSSKNVQTTIDYNEDIKRISENAFRIGETLDKGKLSSKDDEKINQLIDQNYGERYKILITDLKGNIIYKTKNTYETQVDIYTVIKNAMAIGERNRYEELNTNKEVVTFYPIEFTDVKGYVIVKAYPEGIVKTHRYTDGGKPFLSLVISIMFFLGLFFYLTGKKVHYIQEIADAVKEVANGNLKYRVQRKGNDEISNLADNINNMTNELNKRIEKEREIEKTKSELITNVSHDLRTPLTSILGYLNLIKDGKYSGEEEMLEFIQIAYNKSEKLRMLIDELFEYTRLSSDGIKISKVEIALDELIEQLVEEFIPVFLENKIEIKRNIESNIKIDADGDKLVRVFENLFMNAVRYSYKPGLIKINLINEYGYAKFSITNKGKSLRKDEVDKLFDRFYRVEKSRSETTGGTGLGLAISKSIVSLHHGEIWGSCQGEEITFYVKLKISEGN
ncbi:HAMP domain-containing sensor histidine kinase [Clostridium tetani]|uniref:HAMP domain-containing sensor histidine kinase n=1 Tax=Clostridium tetani TaxID=1513 RepID=UPI00100A4D99|nr:HAMP domain-containing sensor histidine kinase [Clostridium tetani]RXM57831.1 two-component sensor histidine kinase [Clostridium tetani]RXM76578.1 two-component sensor histidine kinase [Clostridium tetani]RYU99076.1 two-component sensor histidine kinase [Clostridium tetani]